MQPTPREIQRAYRDAAREYIRKRLAHFPVELVGFDGAELDAFADAIVTAYKVALVDPRMAEIQR